MVVTEPSGDGSAAQRPVRVFLSYAHDAGSAAHQDAVRELWGFLRSHGIDAHLDMEAEGQRRDWALWMADQIRQADHVLVIASPTYRTRAQGHSDPRTGRGVQWEARLIRDAAYQDPDRLDRFVPVVLPGHTVAGVPDFLAPSTTTVYHVRDFTVAGAEQLLRFLTGQPAHVPPPLGPRPVLPSYPPPRSSRSSVTDERAETTAPPRRRRPRWPWPVAGIVVVASAVAIVIAATNAGHPSRPRAAGTAALTTTNAAADAKTHQASAPSSPPATASRPPSTFRGHGDDVITLKRPSGLKIVRFACPHCDGNTVLQTNGTESLLVDTIGPYSGQQLADVANGSNTTKIIVTADSAWTLTVGGIELARTAAGAVSGHGDDVILLTAHTSQARLTNQGQANFIVEDVPPAGGEQNLDVDTIGSYQGTVPLTGPALVQVTSDGSWSLTPSG